MSAYRVTAIAAGLALAFLAQAGARAEVLITEEEAKLPASVNVALNTRGLTRGPGIELEAPAANVNTKSPLPLKIKFQIRNNVAIDQSSVKLTYLKATPVDLTERIKKYVTDNGIDMKQAQVPPGVHLVRVDLKDKEGRVGSAVLKLTVAGN